jgi:DNA anti-recombination protein RmuC
MSLNNSVTVPDGSAIGPADPRRRPQGTQAPGRICSDRPRYCWCQELIAESAREIAETGRQLQRRLAVFAEPFAKVGRQLGSAVVAYNEAVGSFDRRVVPRMRRIEAAGAESDKQLAPITVIEDAPRRSLADLDDRAEARLPRLAPVDTDEVDDVA